MFFSNSYAKIHFSLFTFHFFSYLCSGFKPLRKVAQLVAHYVRDVGVGSSSLLFPTKCIDLLCASLDNRRALVTKAFTLAEIGLCYSKAQEEVKADRNVILVIGNIEGDNLLFFPVRIFHQ